MRPSKLDRHGFLRAPVPAPYTLALVAAVLVAAGGVLGLGPAPGHTRLDLTDGETGSAIFSAVIEDGEQAVLTWKNSLFGLEVIEVFEAREAALVLDQVTFADPRGAPPPRVSPADVEDLYHTGGPFSARGLGKPFHRVVYRVGEIGNPRLRIRNHTMNLKDRVGFGGIVVLSTAAATRFEVWNSHGRQSFAAR